MQVLWSTCRTIHPGRMYCSIVDLLYSCLSVMYRSTCKRTCRSALTVGLHDIVQVRKYKMYMTGSGRQLLRIFIAHEMEATPIYEIYSRTEISRITVPAWYIGCETYIAISRDHCITVLMSQPQQLHGRHLVFSWARLGLNHLSVLTGKHYSQQGPALPLGCHGGRFAC